MLSEIHYPINPREFHDRIYAGEILCFRSLPEMANLVEHTKSLASAAASPHSPPEVHKHFSREEMIDVFGEYQRNFSRSEVSLSIWQNLIEQIGLSPDSLARDRLLARVQTPKEDKPEIDRNRVVSTLRFHRDTWGSNLYSQVNWWAPIYPISAGRTMAIYPEFWDKPVPNTSAEFDLSDVIRRSRDASIPSPDVDAVIPHMQPDFDPGVGEPVLIEPGDLIAFSGAHAHISVAENTGLTRFSFETRSLWIPDVIDGNGAPNIDGQAKWMSPGWFKRMSDRTRLSDILGCDELHPYSPV